MTRKRLNWGAWKANVRAEIKRLNHSVRDTEHVFERLRRDDFVASHKVSICWSAAHELRARIQRAAHIRTLAGSRETRLQDKLLEASNAAQEAVVQLEAAARLLAE